jgi:NAD(P)-dependent dehydrogenase (short-subunit alcohol dehydrogenase family)
VHIPFNTHIQSEFAANNVFGDLIAEQSSVQLAFMNCKGPIQIGSPAWGQIVHDIYQSYLHRHPTVAEYEEVFLDSTTCTLVESGDAMLKAQENVLKKMRSKLGMDPSTDLAGKNVLVTGGSRGIGFDMAVLAAAQGATVIAVSRSKDWYDWSKAAATGTSAIYDKEWYAPVTTTDVSNAAAAWGATAADLLSDTTDIGSKVAYSKRGVRTYKLPQDHLPFYFGPTGIPLSVFDKIHYFSLDIRKRANLKQLVYVHMNDVFGLDTKPDYVFYNAMTEGSFIPNYVPGSLANTADSLDLFNATAKDNVQDVIDATSHIRHNTKGVATSSIEFDVGTGVLMWLLRNKFGDSIKTDTIHVFSSSIAVLSAMEFGSVEGVQPVGLPSRSAYSSHYAMAKLRMLEFAASMRSQGWNTVAPLIGANNGMVNYAWVNGLVNAGEFVPGFFPEPLPTGTTLEWVELPMAVDKIDATGASSDSGHWIAGMSAGGYQMYHSIAGGGYAAGGWIPSTYSTALRMWKIAKAFSNSPTCFPIGFVLENKQDFGLAANAFKGLDINVFTPKRMDGRGANIDFSKSTSSMLQFLIQNMFLSGQTHWRTKYTLGAGKAGNCNSLSAYDYPFTAQLTQ